jgi:transposase
MFIILEICVGAAYPIATLLVFLVAIILIFIYAFFKTVAKNRRRWNGWFGLGIIETSPLGRGWSMANKSSQKRYPDELKERAVKMVLELQREDPHDHGVFSRVARELGVGSESLRTWVKRSEIQLGVRAGMTDAEREELTKLRREVKELKRANAILQSASAFFGAELDRRSQK